MKLWNNEIEKQFFIEALKNFASLEQIFYKINADYFAYIPKNINGNGQTLQSRNALIGQYTEKWTRDIFSPIAGELGLFAVNGVVSESIGLSKKSSADLAFCTSNNVNQPPENIKIIFEIKMSIVSNYKFIKSNQIEFIGDYKSHKGNPALLRSDSMLKAIGKSINIRVAGIESSKIPIIVLGNSPITDTYASKVDFLKNAGVIQGFWSLNPTPTTSNFIKKTLSEGFQTIENIESLKLLCENLLKKDLNYFSSMVSKQTLGKIISIANRENSDILKAEKFLQLMREV
jgi:hypothetical protein